MDAKEIAKLFRDNYSLLHANVVLGAPLSVIKQILQLDDDDLLEEEDSTSGNDLLRYPYGPKTVELLINALSYGGRGVFTFLVNKIKENCHNFCNLGGDNKENIWSNFVDMVKERLEEFNIRKTEDPVKVVDFVTAFPESLCTRACEGFLSPLEVCYTRNDIIGDDGVNLTSLAEQIVKNPNNTFSLEPECVLSYSYSDALPVILTKVNEFSFCWDKKDIDYQRDDVDRKHMETMSKIIRQLFHPTTTVTTIGWYADHSPTLNRNPQFIQNIMQSSLLSSTEEGETTTTINCPIEQATVVLNSARGCALLPLLPHMNQLNTLTVELYADAMSSIKSNDWQVIVDLVAQQGRLRSLTFNMDSIRCNQSEPFLTILEAVRNSSTLEAFHMDIPSHEGEVSIKDTVHELQERMVDILQQNTTLKKVMIYTERTWQSTFAQKIRYLSCLNRFGRGCIREERTINLRRFLHLLDGVVVVDDEKEERFGIENILHAINDNKEYQKVSANMKTSMFYGLLHERPAIWIQNQNHQSASSCTTTNPTTTIATLTTTTTGERKRGDGD